MRRFIMCAMLLALLISSGGCPLFIDGQIKRSASIDFNQVDLALKKIDAGEEGPDYAVTTLRRIWAPMRDRVNCFYGRDPESDGSGD